MVLTDAEPSYPRWVLTEETLAIERGRQRACTRARFLHPLRQSRHPSPTFHARDAHAELRRKSSAKNAAGHSPG
jgi:hypothetical protein